MRVPATLKGVAFAAMWGAVLALVLLGLVASAGRGISVFQLAQSPPGSRPDISPYDSASFAAAIPLYGALPGTARYSEIEADSRRMARKFGEFPGTTLMHVLPGALFLLLAPLQFSRRIRTRHLRLHRWSGRLLVALGIPIGLTGLFFGLVNPFGGPLEAATVAIVGTLFLFALARAVIAIRRREIATHREWMIRVFAIALGISAVRLVGIAFALTTGTRPAVWFAHSVWIGFLLTLSAAELWIRATTTTTTRLSHDLTRGGTTTVGSPLEPAPPTG